MPVRCFSICETMRSEVLGAGRRARAAGEGEGRARAGRAGQLERTRGLRGAGVWRCAWEEGGRAGAERGWGWGRAARPGGAGRRACARASGSPGHVLPPRGGRSAREALGGRGEGEGSARRVGRGGGEGGTHSRKRSVQLSRQLSSARANDDPIEPVTHLRRAGEAHAEGQLTRRGEGRFGGERRGGAAYLSQHKLVCKGVGRAALGQPTGSGSSSAR